MLTYTQWMKDVPNILITTGFKAKVIEISLTLDLTYDVISRCWYKAEHPRQSVQFQAIVLIKLATECCIKHIKYTVEIVYIDSTVYMSTWKNHWTKSN
jgi:hypothetical protein